ncbi:hypothetical protein TU77_22330 [Pseudomonas synxantha]|nr:hypothetical protein TU77_22330 [Pseudomonas synxantha]
MRKILLNTVRHKRCAMRSTARKKVGCKSGRQIEAMTADGAEIVRQDVTIQFFAKLSAKRAPSHTASKAAEDCSGDRVEGDT